MLGVLVSVEAGPVVWVGRGGGLLGREGRKVVGQYRVWV